MDLDRIIRLPELLEITGASRSTLYRWIREGCFPPPVRLGPNSTGWPQSQVREWLDSLQPVSGPYDDDGAEA